MGTSGFDSTSGQRSFCYPPRPDRDVLHARPSVTNRAAAPHSAASYRLSARSFLSTDPDFNMGAASPHCRSDHYRILVKSYLYGKYSERNLA